jgi:phenylacetate-coenzyme A ligase PaaK-like adenylate-forming protein
LRYCIGLDVIHYSAKNQIDQYKNMTIEKASPAQMRKSLEIVEAFKQSGIMFVPVPVLNETELNAMTFLANSKLEEIEKLNKDVE